MHIEPVSTGIRVPRLWRDGTVLRESPEDGVRPHHILGTRDFHVPRESERGLYDRGQLYAVAFCCACYK